MNGHLAGLVVTTDPGGFTRATAPSRVSLQWMLAAVDHLVEITKGSESSRVLLDLSRVMQPPGLVEQAIIGEHLARKLSHCAKVASVVADGTRTGTSERVAHRLDLALRVFTGEREAIAWLRS